ncbi:hypothetical protein D9613_005911 [Agrocybe pediades]|uniref:POP1-domain-containing protein n=1 Tax=Agrocybe pediades TaxID=84607 RepID=A0A8H4QUD9_9AGAR|nr:hypothetical protein D9613_005911 [Agrocybe pediades]
MSQKRRNAPDTSELTGREKKKLKVTAARTINVQPTSQASGSGGPSNSNAVKSATKLPATIDVEKFVEARQFEINAMHKAMKTASASSTHRVWQTLPRHLRRRAASHDVRRVPLKLRDRARAEMDPLRKKAAGNIPPRSKKGKEKNRTETLLKRQRDKSWLETHIWHAKRMHMENLWGYRLAISPTEKSYRPSYRASIHGSILHDASYYSLLEIKGKKESAIQAMLDMCCDPQGPGPSSKRWSPGSRVLETHLYKIGSYPYDLIAPVTILWRPVQKEVPPSGKQSTQPIDTQQQSDIRTVWLRFHPSAQSIVVETLKAAASRALEAHRNLHGDLEPANVEIADLRGHVNVFEITGPKASQVIKGALSPVSNDKRPEFAQFWSSLTNLQNSGSLPRGMVIGFTVNDPRLRFPPKNAKPSKDAATVIQSNITLPSSSLAQSDIWEDSIRNGLAKLRFKKKDIDKRRADASVPGTPLTPLRQDDRVPVLLIQHSVEAPGSNDSQARHGWTLMLPAGWSMAFFSSLIYTSTRVAGQFERQTQSYEAGVPYFPRDYPFAETYEAYAEDLEAKERETWERKPPAKRPNYEKLGVLNPWKADWRKVLGLSPAEENLEDGGSAFASTQRDVPMDEEGHSNSSSIRPWLLRGSECMKLIGNISSVFNATNALYAEVNRLRAKRGMQPLPEYTKPQDLLQGALVNVKVTMNLRGVPEDLAAIYNLPDDLYRKWAKIIFTGKMKDSNEDLPEEVELAERIGKESAVVGHITTGHYSLARGEGFAIGAVALTRLLELDQQATRLYHSQKSPPMLVVVRNNNSRQCRVGHLQLIEA